jgi:hypothetical protein
MGVSVVPWNSDHSKKNLEPKTALIITLGVALEVALSIAHALNLPGLLWEKGKGVDFNLDLLR